MHVQHLLRLAGHMFDRAVASSICFPHLQQTISGSSVTLYMASAMQHVVQYSLVFPETSQS